MAMRKLRKWWKENAVLLLGQGVLSVCRGFFRVQELLALPNKKAKLRAFREQMEAMDIRKRQMLDALKSDSKTGGIAMLEWQEKLLKEHGTPEQLARIQQLRVTALANDADRERLKEILHNAGEDTDKLIGDLHTYLVEHPSSTLSLHILAANLRKKGEFEESIATFEEEMRVIQQKESSEALPHRLYFVKQSIGETLLRKGDTEQAIALFKQLIDSNIYEKHSMPFLTHLYLGEAFLSQGNTSDARKTWKQAMTLTDVAAHRKEVKKRLDSLS